MYQPQPLVYAAAALAIHGLKRPRAPAPLPIQNSQQSAPHLVSTVNLAESMFLRNFQFSTYWQTAPAL